jgi:hypothetical protein
VPTTLGACRSLVFLPLCLVLPNVASGQISFTDVTISSGLREADSLANAAAAAAGWTGTLTWGHRIAWADVTGDDLPDLFVGRVPNLLLRNNGDGTFSDIADVTGYRAMPDLAHGGVAFDLENDGDRDWFANGDWDLYPSEAEVLARNDGGTFVDVVSQSTAISGSPGSASSGTRGVAAADFDLDGFLDLVAVTSIENPPSANSDDHVFWNDGTGRYLAATTLSTANVKNQGVQTIDFDHDGDMDIYTNRRDKANYLFRNDGSRSFSQMSQDVGLALNDTESDDGAAWGDIDADGDLDFVCGGKILANDGSGSFTQVGTYSNESAYCVGLADLDNDGDLDFVVPSNAGPASHFENDGSGIFTEVTGVGLQAGPVNDRRTVAFADYDADGLLDLGFADKNTWNTLFRNTTTNAGNWLKVKLYRASGQVDAIGSFVYAYPAGELGNGAALLGMRHAEGATGYCAMHDPVLHFGLGAAATVDVRIVFPGGAVVDTTGVAANGTIVITEGGVPPVGVESWIARASADVTAFPNPFRAATTIAFSNPARAASVAIYDVQGRLVQRYEDLRGTEIRWDAPSRPNGIYFVRVRSGRAETWSKITRIR